MEDKTPIVVIELQKVVQNYQKFKNAFLNAGLDATVTIARKEFWKLLKL